uniref:Uncharacterized protein n=1 Tax=viral metagenome TaxID=1070528 RepID=A0A6C0H8I4_9ZZZZ
MEITNLDKLLEILNDTEIYINEKLKGPINIIKDNIKKELINNNNNYYYCYYINFLLLSKYVYKILNDTITKQNHTGGIIIINYLNIIQNIKIIDKININII